MKSHSSGIRSSHSVRPSPRARPSFAAYCVCALLHRPPRWLGTLWPGPVEVDGNRLDPGLAWLCRHVSRSLKLHELPPEQARRRLRKTSALLTCGRPALDSVENLTIPWVGGFRVRVYSPVGLGPESSAVVYFHGGGWVLGGLDSHDSLCAVMAAQLGAKVVAVDYRLAPENPFPAAVDDARAAFSWVQQQTASWGMDPERVAVAGDSAGANLAAVVSALGGIPSDDMPDPGRPSAQLLFYPVIDGARGSRSYELFAEGFGLSRTTMDWFYDCYCGSTDPMDPRISPIAADDFRGLPQTVLSLAGFDVLRDEGLAYADALRAAEVQVECLVFPSLIHSFANMTGLPQCRQAFDQSLSTFAELLKP